jgi:hypothetical protein
MTDPTPKAPDAVPEAVRTAIREAEETAVALAERRSGQTEIDYDCAHTAMEKAIVTALREATETRDQKIARLTDRLRLLFDENANLDADIARLTTELAAAKADTARLDWLSQPRDRIAFGINKADNIPGCSLYVDEDCYEPFDAATLREAIDAARAAEREG